MTGIDKGPIGSPSASETLETDYPPRRASAAQMRRALRAYLRERAVEATVIYDVVLAADEAFNNAVGHAGAVDGLIRVTARVSESDASVEVQDGGRGFSLRGSGPPSAPDVRRTDGRGIFLMKSLMDEVSVRSGREGTVVQMVRHLSREAHRRDDPEATAC